MSGSGGGGGSGGVERTNCEDLFDQTPLNSANAAVLKGLNVGDILKVELKTNPGGARPSVVAVRPKPKPEIAGAITSAIAPRLIDCIGKGFKYVAVVKELKGGQCTVEVRPAAKS